MSLENVVLDVERVISTANILRNIDMKPIDMRLVSKHGDESYVEGLKEEAIRFLAISAVGQDRYAPSQKVDEYWHELVLNTPLYRNISQRIGVFVDHLPSNRAEVESYARTLDVYSQVFGSLNSRYWKLNSAADCESFCTSGACEASCRD